MTRTAKKPRQPAAAKELRAESIVLVDAKGRECAHLTAGEKGTLLRMKHPDSGFTLDLRIDDESAGMTIEYANRPEPLIAALLAFAEPKNDVSGYGVLHLHDAEGDVTEGGSDRHTIQAEHLGTLRSFSDWLPTRDDPDELRVAIDILRSVHRTNSAATFERVKHSLRAEDRDDGRVRT
jgi:hypothetical protein